MRTGQRFGLRLNPLRKRVPRLKRYTEASLESKAAAQVWNEQQEMMAMGSLDEQIAKLQALKASSDNTVSSHVHEATSATDPAAPISNMEQTKMTAETNDIFGSDSDEVEVPVKEQDTPVTPKAVVAVKLSKSAPAPATTLVEVECDTTGMMTFQHSGMTVYKQSKEDADDSSLDLNDGDFRLLIADEQDGGVEDGSFTHYGKMTEAGEITIELSGE